MRKSSESNPSNMAKPTAQFRVGMNPHTEARPVVLQLTAGPGHTIETLWTVEDADIMAMALLKYAELVRRKRAAAVAKQ